MKTNLVTFKEGLTAAEVDREGDAEHELKKAGTVGYYLWDAKGPIWNSVRCLLAHLAAFLEVENVSENRKRFHIVCEAFSRHWGNVTDHVSTDYYQADAESRHVHLSH